MIEETDAYGFRFKVLSSDTGVGRCFRQFGEFGRIGSTMCAQLAAGKTFLDVGASVGAYALPVARRARHVIAIEPQPAIVALLRENVALNGLENIAVVEAVATSDLGEVEFPSPDPSLQINFGVVGRGYPAPSVMVPAVQLDGIATDDTAMIKIDVEGHEAAVLDGATGLVGAAQCYWLVEANRDSQEARNVIERFRRDYRLYWFYDPFITPRCARGTWDGSEPGDISVFAAPRGYAQPVGMVEIDATYAWPTTTAGFAYLNAFGIGAAPGAN